MWNDFQLLTLHHRLNDTGFTTVGQRKTFNKEFFSPLLKKLRITNVKLLYVQHNDRNTNMIIYINHCITDSRLGTGTSKMWRGFIAEPCTLFKYTKDNI